MNEHQDIANLLVEMKLAVARDDPRALYDAWSRFERGLGDHLRFEEGELLWRYAKVDREEAAALRAEHDHIRKLVSELGISVDLHTMRLEIADQLIEELRAHAKREDEGLYRWAEVSLPPEEIERAHVGEEVRRSLDTLRLKIHLLGLDARDEYRRVVDRLRHLAAPLD